MTRRTRANGHLWLVAVAVPTVLLALVGAGVFGWIGGGAVSAGGLPAVVIGAQGEVGVADGLFIGDEGTAQQSPDVAGDSDGTVTTANGTAAGTAGASGRTSMTGCTSAVAESGGTACASSEMTPTDECKKRETVAQPLRLRGVRGGDDDETRPGPEPGFDSLGRSEGGSSGSDEGRGHSR